MAIEESDLIREIEELTHDINTSHDKVDLYMNPSDETEYAHLIRLYSQHVAETKAIEAIIGIGRKHFPEKDWSKLTPDYNSSDMVGYLENCMKNTLTGRNGAQLVTNKYRFENL